MCLRFPRESYLLYSKQLRKLCPFQTLNSSAKFLRSSHIKHTETAINKWPEERKKQLEILLFYRFFFAVLSVIMSSFWVRSGSFSIYWRSDVVVHVEFSYRVFGFEMLLICENGYCQSQCKAGFVFEKKINFWTSSEMFFSTLWASRSSYNAMIVPLIRKNNCA